MFEDRAQIHEAGCLDRISVKSDTMTPFVTDFCNICDGLDRSDFIVRVHDSDQRGFVGYRRPQVRWINHAVAVYG